MVCDRRAAAAKYYGLVGLNNGNLSSHRLEAGSLRLGCPQSGVLLRSLFLAYKWCFLPMSSCSLYSVHVCPNLFFF